MPSLIRTRSEFTVNSHVAGGQGSSSVATFADGGFIVTWTTSDPAQDGEGSAVKAQLFDSAGRKVGYEFLVNADPDGSQFQPKVATLPDGKFVVTWLTQVGGGVPNSIKTQLFDRSGAPIGGEVQVNATGTSIFEPNVTALADGRYLVSWDDWSGGVRAQIFDSSGARVGGIVTLATVYANGYGEVVALANGGFVATWRDSWDIYAQIFSPSGAKVGSPFLAHTNTTGYQNEAAAVALAGGGFVLTWTHNDTGPGSVRAQIFSATGQRVGGELVVNTQSGDGISSPVATALPDGGFFVAWHIRVPVSGGGSNTDVKGQRFSADGVKVDGEMLIVSNTAGSQSLPDLATLADGRIIATWSSELGDGDASAIRAQILGTELAAPLPNTAPTIISNASPVHDENLKAVTRVVASDDGEPSNLRYSITGGVDSAFFTINALTGALSFVSAPDHETPLDSNGDNHYEVTVSASDGTLSGSQALSIYVRDANQVTIVSDGGDYNAYFQGGENHSAVTIVSAVDAEGMPLTYSISGGDDAALFTIDAQTGELSFITAPDFELPQDRYGDNYYVVEVTASDGTFSDTQRIDVQIEDVLEDGQVVITSDGGGDEAEVWVEENSAIATTVSATGSGEVVYEIVGGYDASRFTIDSVTGVLAFVDAPDYEDLRGDAPWYGYNPKDWDYELEVIVRASDGASFDEQYLIFNITDVDEAPEFYSYDGDSHVNLMAPEGEFEAAEFVAYDPDRSYGPETPPTFEIQGADGALFELDLLQDYPERGTLRFIVAPDYESPSDSDGDNVYEVTVVAHAGGLSSSQSYSIWVGDQDDAISIGSDGGGDQADVWVGEHYTEVTIVAASGGSGAITYSIAGGADASAFVIDAATGALAFGVSPDYEAFADADGDNVYDVVVRASDNASFDDQTLAVRVYDLEDFPYFPDYPAGETVSLTMTENWTHVADIFAVDPDVSSGPITYSIAGGADAALFAIDPVTGALSLISAADFEAPADSDGDNAYEVEVAATTGSATTGYWSRIQSFSITVENEYETLAITSGATASVVENDRAVTTVTAFVDGDPASFTISGGADSALFAIDAATGALSFVAAPDFEAPADSDGDNVYEVEVSAGDGRTADSKSISVTVTNEGEPAALGGEFVVNSTYARSQADSNVTLLADGTFVVVWIDANYNSSAGRFLRAQIFAPDGVKIGDELTLHDDYTVGIEPEVEALPDGGFVAVWKGIGTVHARMYDSAGEATTGRLDVSTGGTLSIPQVAVFADGGFAITWSSETWNGTTYGSSEVRLRLYDSAGAPVGGERIVNSSTAGEQTDPSIAVLTGGGYVVTWTDRAVPTGASIAKAQIFDSAGARVGGELIVAPAEGSNGVIETSVVTLANGNFAVAWSQGVTGGGPGYRVQIFTSEGVMVGGQIVAPTYAYGRQIGPSISALSDGGLAIAWSADGTPYSDGSGKAIYVQAYDSAGQASGAATRVNGQANGDQIEPSIAGLGDGRFVVTWTDLNGSGADDDQTMARIFAPEDYVPNQRPVFESPASVQVDEGQTAVALVAASDSDGPGTVTYSIAGGADAGLFEIDPSTGALSFKAAPDYEAPAAGSGNVYAVTVKASDGELSSFQSLQVAVRNVNEAVTITSGSAASVAENSTAVAVVTATDVDGDPVSYAIAGGADSALFAVDAQTGALSFLAAPNFEAPADSNGDNVYEVEVSASDGSLSDSKTVTVTVTGRDEAPAFVSYGGAGTVSLALNEGGLQVGGVQAVDPEGAAMAYAIAGGADSDLFEVDPDNGALIFKQARDFEAPADSDGDNVYQVTVAATSGGLSATQSFSVAVADVNENVAITSNGGGDSAAVSTAENGTAVTVVAAATGVGPVSYSIVGGADAAEFTIDSATGALAFAAAPNFEWTVDFDHDNVFEVTVRASNGINSDDQHISVNLTNVDEAPDFFDHEPGVVATWASENLAYVGIYQAYDIDGGPEITHSVTGGADGALFVIDPLTGELSFAGAGGPDFEAPADADGDNVYEVEITASQGSWSRARIFTVEVLNENEQPRITSNGGGTSAAIEMNEGQTAVTTVTSVDDGPNPVTYSITGGSDAGVFAIDSASGALSFISAPDYEGPFGDSTGFYTVEVTASDGQLSSSQTIQVTVRDVAEAVTITSEPALSMNEERGYVGRILASDGDAEAISWSIVGGADAAHFTINPYTGDLSTSTLLDFEAPVDADGDNVYDVTVRASDSHSSDERQLSITVNDVDDDLEIVSYGGADLVSFTMEENVSFYVANVDANLSLYPGVTFSIGGGADAALFRIDPDNGMLSFAFPFAPDYEAPSDSNGDNVYDVVVVASRLTTSDSQAFAVTIANRNESLAITSPGGVQPSLTVNEGNRVVTTVVAVDKDATAPAYSIVGGADAALFAIDGATGVLTFIADPDYETIRSASGINSYVVEVGATDGMFWSFQTLRVMVNNLAEDVAITSGGGGANAAVTVGENGLAVTSVVAADPDGRPVTYAIAGGADAARFTINASTGALTFVSAPNFEAPADAGGNNVYDVVVSASDGASTDTQALAVTVGNVNEAVAIGSNGGGDSATVTRAENGTAVTVVAASDADGGAVTYAIAGGADASRFTIDAATGALAFIAAPNFEAPGDSGANNVYDVLVSASDGSFTDTQAIAVTVGNVNEAPAITSGGGGAGAAVSVVENSLAVAVVAASDPDGTSPTYSIVGGADAARFTINAQTGALQFVAAPDWELPVDSDGDNVYAVVVRSSDGQLFDEQALSVTVTNTRDGNNVIGTVGGDSISATSSNAALRTSNEEDLVFGRDGHDTIQGMAGDDELYGEAGNDVLVGGAGADKLLGGLGKDQFTYNALSESTAAARDLIMDFSRSQGDKISLSAVDANSLVSNNQAFTFIGTSAFSNVAGQLRYETSAGMTTIFGDVNGDGIADLQIQLSGSVALVSSDFIL